MHISTLLSKSEAAIQKALWITDITGGKDTHLQCLGLVSFTWQGDDCKDIYADLFEERPNDLDVPLTQDTSSTNHTQLYSYPQLASFCYAPTSTSAHSPAALKKQPCKTQSEMQNVTSASDHMPSTDDSH